MRRWYDVLLNEDGDEGHLVVNLTHEGIIVDLCNQNGEVMGTFGATAQELADDFAH